MLVSVFNSVSPNWFFLCFCLFLAGIHTQNDASLGCALLPGSVLGWEVLGWETRLLNILIISPLRELSRAQYILFGDDTNSELRSLCPSVSSAFFWAWNQFCLLPWPTALTWSDPCSCSARCLDLCSSSSRPAALILALGRRPAPSEAFPDLHPFPLTLNCYYIMPSFFHCSNYLKFISFTYSFIVAASSTSMQAPQKQGPCFSFTIDSPIPGTSV